MKISHMMNALHESPELPAIDRGDVLLPTVPSGWHLFKTFSERNTPKFVDGILKCICMNENVHVYIVWNFDKVCSWQQVSIASCNGLASNEPLSEPMLSTISGASCLHYTSELIPDDAFIRRWTGSSLPGRSLGVYHEDLEENRPRFNGTTLYQINPIYPQTWIICRWLLS